MITSLADLKKSILSLPIGRKLDPQFLPPVYLKTFQPFSKEVIMSNAVGIFFKY